MIKTTLQAIVVATAAYVTLPAMAADDTTTPATTSTTTTTTTTAPSPSASSSVITTLPPTAAGETPITRQEARDLKTESKAEYKARKKVTDAQKVLDIADCKTAGLEPKEQRDCKKEAKDAAKAAKKEAKEIYKEDKAEIKANTQ